MGSPRATIEGFWSRVDASGDCWQWQGHLQRGYGATADPRQDRRARQVRVHRLAYELLIGPIPGGLGLDHLCRNRSCVNPDHLEAVTTRQNLLRGVGFAALHARSTRCRNGHPFDATNTLVLTGPRPGRACRECMRQAGKRYRAKRRSTLGRAAVIEVTDD